MDSCFKMGYKGKEDKNSSMATTDFLKNGGKLLEEMIASSGGKCNPIRSFSTKDLQQATNNFHHDQITVEKSSFTLYRGIIRNRLISVKTRALVSPEHSIIDIVIGSQMSAHKNVLKLIGCCLEIPMVVYQYDCSFTTLHDYIFATTENIGLQPLPWNCRIKVATCLANAIAYLHTALLRPVVCRTINPRTIVMDANNVPRLLDFSFAVIIPEGETHVCTDRVVGTYGFLAPEYLGYGRMNEKTDVYSFGILLLMLLTGRDTHDSLDENEDSFIVDGVGEYVRKNRLKEIMDHSIVAEESWLGKEQQIQQFCGLAFRCLERSRKTDLP